MEKIRAIVIDDDKYTVKVIKLCLENLNISADGYTNPISALENIKEKKYDLIITDNSMPHIDGIELAERVLQIYKPTLVLISVVCDQVKTSFDGKAIFDYIFQKPFDFDELTIELKKIIKDIQVSKILDHIEIKDKLFLKDIARILADQEDEGGLYKIISEEMQKDKSTIRKRLSKISTYTGASSKELIKKFRELEEANDDGKKKEASESV